MSTKKSFKEYTAGLDSLNYDGPDDDLNSWIGYQFYMLDISDVDDYCGYLHIPVKSEETKLAKARSEYAYTFTYFPESLHEKDIWRIR